MTPTPDRLRTNSGQIQGVFELRHAYIESPNVRSVLGHTSDTGLSVGLRLTVSVVERPSHA